MRLADQFLKGNPVFLLCEWSTGRSEPADPADRCFWGKSRVQHQIAWPKQDTSASFMDWPIRKQHKTTINARGQGHQVYHQVFAYPQAFEQELHPTSSGFLVMCLKNSPSGRSPQTAIKVQNKSSVVRHDMGISFDNNFLAPETHIKIYQNKIWICHGTLPEKASLRTWLRKTWGSQFRFVTSLWLFLCL